MSFWVIVWLIMSVNAIPLTYTQVKKATFGEELN